MEILHEQRTENAEHVFLNHMSKTACAIVCTYSGFILVAAELSEDVLCMGGAYADLGEARQSLGRHIELGAHLRSTGIDKHVIFRDLDWK